MSRHNKNIRKGHAQALKKYFAITAIYLMISLTFFTARALAILDYQIKGENGIADYARRSGDIVEVTTTSDSNVSFVATSQQQPEIPLSCTGEGPGGVHCSYYLEQSDVSMNVETIPFMLKQESGTPLFKSGTLMIDGDAPINNSFAVEKGASGLLFRYSFSDGPLSGQGQAECIGSGIGKIEIYVQGKLEYSQAIAEKTCSIVNETFINLTNVYKDKITYTFIIKDRVGNEFSTGLIALGGDFRAPKIANTYKIIRNGAEVSTLSKNAEITADIIVEVEDNNLSVDAASSKAYVRGDLSLLNTNPAVNMDPAVKDAKAECMRESGNLYRCIFSNVRIRPQNVGITITAKDAEGNIAVRTITSEFLFLDDAGTVAYLGPTKDHCTSDLSRCYLRSGIQLIQAELKSASSYNKSMIFFGMQDERKFAICRFNSTWTCASAYNVPSDLSSFKIYISESYDDYGNELMSDIERTVYIDNDRPIKSGELKAENSNNNDCAVSGDQIIFTQKVKDQSAGMKIYANTSQFTTEKVQKGTCIPSGNDEWDCTLTIKNFGSVPKTVDQNIMIEDLAGNPLAINHTFKVCKSSVAGAPNVIFGAKTRGTLPAIDRRTASKIPVKVFVPMAFDVQDGASLMYLTVDRCKALGMNNMDVMDSGNYFLTGNGNNPILVLYVGNDGAQLPEDDLVVNCSISARVRVGPTVYTQDQKYDFSIKVPTRNNPLGTVDSATNSEINTVKKHLRDIDDEIKSREVVDKILGTICKFAESLGKTNSIIQAVKAVIYGIFIALVQVPAFKPAIVAAWAAVQGTMGTFHAIVTQYVWPPGMLPKPGAAVGTVVKYTCTVYTCKHLDVGLYTGLMVEIGSTAMNDMANLGKVGTSDETPADQSSSSQPDPSVSQAPESTTPEGYAQKMEENNERIQDPIKRVEPITKAKILPISNVNPISLAKAPVIKSADPPHVATFQERMKAQGADLGLNDQAKYMSDALNGHQWIVNPYKSIHYDDTCNPAIIYNLKKDRQISCMYLECLQDQAETGLPKVICDGNYKINKCLYLDSAEYLLNGRGSAFNAFMRGLGDALKASALGMSIQLIYSGYCYSDFVPGGHLKDMVIETGGLHSAICGVTGSVFALKEIIDYAHNPLSAFRNKDPAEGKDFCSGLDYSEESETETNEELVGGEYVE